MAIIDDYDEFADGFDPEENHTHEELAAEDYALIIGPDGKLKSIILPEHLPQETPSKLKEVLELLGVFDMALIGGKTTFH